MRICSGLRPRAASFATARSHAWVPTQISHSPSRQSTVQFIGSRVAWARNRSEEHTSELQSQSNLVCRLLLEKKKKRANVIVAARRRAHSRRVPAPARGGG